MPAAVAAAGPLSPREMDGPLLTHQPTLLPCHGVHQSSPESAMEPTFGCVAN